MKAEYTIEKPEDFREIIDDLLLEHQSEESLVITLTGDLGAGKTAFAKELAAYFGVTEPVTSPTFTIMKKYQLESEKFSELIHIDAYRIESEDEVGPLDLDSLVGEKRNIIAIEWPERILSTLPANFYNLTLKITEGDTRLVTASRNN
tara:strand:+ start:32994 stop:33437 length:444 start_codon:yes stop_codon:yes gene_type:complete